MGIQYYRSGDGPYGGNSRAKSPWPMVLVAVAIYALAITIALLVK